MAVASAKKKPTVAAAGAVGVKKKSGGGNNKLALPDVMTMGQAAAALGVSRSLFYRDVLPQLRCVYLGRARVVPVPELERWLEKEAVR